VSATLKLTRKVPVMEVFHRGTFDVLVDGKGVGSIESDGDTFETPVAPGRHTLQVREGRYSSRELSFQVTDGQVISFRCLRWTSRVPVQPSKHGASVVAGRSAGGGYSP
jgi:hypothetical protein